MKRDHSFSLLMLPLVVLLIFAATLWVERSGVRYEASSNYRRLHFLPQENLKIDDYFSDRPVEALVLYDIAGSAGEKKHVKTVLNTLDSMQVKYDTFGVSGSGAYDLSRYRTVVISFLDLEKIQPKISALADWVGDGGQVLFTIRPEPSGTFQSIYRKLGIISLGTPFIVAKGIEFRTDILPGAQGMSLGLDLFSHTSYPVELDVNSRVHLVSADQYRTPLLWEYDYEQGHFVFINSDQFIEKNSRGILGAAYALLQDVFVYPVINSSVFFIDDFPAPIRAGGNELITTQYNRDIQGFFINIWWPDLEKISRQYHIKYTGVTIETYNDNVTPPFTKQPELERHQYFGGLLLNNGGELGFHGYNHVPLCLAGDNVNQLLDYPVWPSTESMQWSLYELYSFANDLFPGNSFVTYVPPSNVLCPAARKWLPGTLPGLKVIASTFLPDADGLVYEQEFSEAPDGIVEFPRIVTGYEVTDHMYWASLNELGLHYVSSYSIQPNDVLDVNHGADTGWAFLRERFEAYVKRLTESAPGLRQMTAGEGAMAVQRFARLAVKTENVDGNYEISLGNFYDDAWLMLRTSKTPLAIEGGTITRVSMDLYLINAFRPKIIISFEE